MADQNNHVKPTQEELDRQIQQATEELDKMDQSGQGEDTVSESESDSEQSSDTQKQEETELQSDQQEDTSTQTPPPVQEKQQDNLAEEDREKEKEVDFKKKFTESSRESQILLAKNKKMGDAFEMAEKTPPPTEEELRKEFPSWDDMTDLEKRLAKNDIHNQRRFEAINQVTKEFKELDQWKDKVDSFVDDPANLAKYPGIDGKEAEFKVFASKPSRRGIDFEDLVASFLWTADSKPVQKSKKQMFPTTSAGPADKAKPRAPEKLSLEKARSLRETNYSEYKRLLLAGKIEEF